MSIEHDVNNHVGSQGNLQSLTVLCVVVITVDKWL